MIGNYDLNYVLTIVGVLIGLVALLFAIWSHFTNKNIKSIYFQKYDTYTLFEKIKEIDGISILLNNKRIENIYMFEIFMFNNGNISLSEDDFLKPINIKFNDSCRIISYEIFTSNEYNTLEYTNSKNDICLNIKSLLKNTMLKINVAYTNDIIGIVDTEVALLNGTIFKESLRSEAKFYFNRRREEKVRTDMKYYLIMFLHGFLIVFILALYELLVYIGLFDDFLIHVSKMNKLLYLLLYGVFVLTNTFRILYKLQKHLYIKKWIKIK
jgi:hypothetical protein